MDLWRGLALIVIVWTGTQMALSGGGLNMASVVKMIVSLSIPLGMLQFYTQPLPGLTYTVPDVITGMGNWLHGVIVAGSGEEMLTELHNMFRGMYDNLMLTPAMPGMMNPLRMWASLMSAIFSGLFGLVLVDRDAPGDARGLLRRPRANCVGATGDLHRAAPGAGVHSVSSCCRHCRFCFGAGSKP